MLQPSIASSSIPALKISRLCRLITVAIDRVGLNLEGLTVLTEAATGSYGVTAPMAALAGAKCVYAVARSSRYGSSTEAFSHTAQIAKQLDVRDRIVYLENLPLNLEGIDVVTNSGHLRPLDTEIISRLSPHCVIGLMYETWEVRESDIALDQCRSKGIRVVGVNERHPAVDVFPFLGPLCVKLLFSAGIPVYSSKVALCCNNYFADYIIDSLRALGAEVSCFGSVGDLSPGAWDAVVLAQQPVAGAYVDTTLAQKVAQVAPSAVFAQLWGDIDRQAFAALGVEVWPQVAPKPGHMGILLSELGPEPIVRLQSGGLRAAAAVVRGEYIEDGGISQLLL